MGQSITDSTTGSIRKQDPAKMLPSKRASLFVILFLIPCVVSFILPQPFRSLFESEAPQSTERQSDLSDQIIPVAIIAFTASLFNSFVAMLFTPQAATVNCTYTGSNWKWGYEGVYGAACWGTHVPACNGVKQSPIDIPAKYGGLLPARPLCTLKGALHLERRWKVRAPFK